LKKITKLIFLDKKNKKKISFEKRVQKKGPPIPKINSANGIHGNEFYLFMASRALPSIALNGPLLCSP
jgi:hypothetical protein